LPIEYHFFATDFMDNSKILNLKKIMTEEQNTATAIAEQITITEPAEKFAQEKEIIAELAKLYPKAFFVDSKQRKPLKTGTFQQVFEPVMTILPNISKTTVRKAMAFYCGDFDYIATLHRETHRIDLNGDPAEEIILKHKIRAEKQINPTNATQNTPENTPKRETKMAETLTLKRKTAAAPTENKSSPVKPNQASGDTANASAKSAKITLVLATDSITRVNSDGKKQIKLVVQVGEMKFAADLNSKSYRKALATIDEFGAENCNAILQGSMPKFGILEGVGLVVQAKKAKE
jgi:sRNA-binding protein